MIRRQHFRAALRGNELQIGERRLGVALARRGPGVEQRQRQFGERSLCGLRNLRARAGEVAMLERFDGKREPRRAVVGLLRDHLAGEHGGLFHVAIGGGVEKSVVEQIGVAGIAREAFAEQLRRVRQIVLAGGEPRRKIIAIGRRVGRSRRRAEGRRRRHASAGR